MKPELEFDPHLVEEAVPRALMEPHLKRTFHRERERAYAFRDPEERDRAFRDIHSHWFRRLGLASSVRLAIQERGKPLAGVSRWLITGAISTHQSGAELFVADGARRSVVVRILPATLAENSRALPFLRRELLYIADMLDPTFEYEPKLPSSPLGPPEDRRIQDRYSVLWRCSVEGRLVRESKLPVECRNECLAQFRILFPALEERSRDCFEKIFAKPRPLHSVFVALATQPEVAFGLRSHSTERRRRCPLCGFPTTDFEPGAPGLSRSVCRAIRMDFHGWKKVMGLCRQCADLYRALTSRPGPLPSTREDGRTPPWSRRAR